MIVCIVEYDNVDHEYTLNVGGITGKRYIGIGYTSRSRLYISAGTGKSTESSPATNFSIGNHNLKVKEIYLYIPNIT